MLYSLVPRSSALPAIASVSDVKLGEIQSATAKPEALKLKRPKPLKRDQVREPSEQRSPALPHRGETQGVLEKSLGIFKKR